MFGDRIQKWVSGSIKHVQDFFSRMKRPALLVGEWHKKVFFHKLPQLFKLSVEKSRGFLTKAHGGAIRVSKSGIVAFRGVMQVATSKTIAKGAAFVNKSRTVCASSLLATSRGFMALVQAHRNMANKSATTLKNVFQALADATRGLLKAMGRLFSASVRSAAAFFESIGGMIVVGCRHSFTVLMNVWRSLGAVLRKVGRILRAWMTRVLQSVRSIVHIIISVKKLSITVVVRLFDSCRRGTRRFARSVTTFFSNLATWSVNGFRMIAGGGYAIGRFFSGAWLVFVQMLGNVTKWLRKSGKNTRRAISSLWVSSTTRIRNFVHAFGSSVNHGFWWTIGAVVQGFVYLKRSVKHGSVRVWAVVTTHARRSWQWLHNGAIACKRAIGSLANAIGSWAMRSVRAVGHGVSYGAARVVGIAYVLQHGTVRGWRLVRNGLLYSATTTLAVTKKSAVACKNGMSRAVVRGWYMVQNGLQRSATATWAMTKKSAFACRSCMSLAVMSGVRAVQRASVLSGKKIALFGRNVSNLCMRVVRWKLQLLSVISTSVWSGITTTVVACRKGITKTVCATRNAGVAVGVAVAHAGRKMWKGLRAMSSAVRYGIIVSIATCSMGIKRIVHAIKNAGIAVGAAVTRAACRTWQCLCAMTSAIWRGITISVAACGRGIMRTVRATQKTGIASGVAIACAARWIWQGLCTMAGAVWHGITSSIAACGKGIMRTARATHEAGIAVGAVVARATRRTWQGLCAMTRAVWRGITTTVVACRKGITKTVCATRNAGVAVGVAVAHAARRTWQGLCALTSAVWRGITASVVACGKGITSTVRAIKDAGIAVGTAVARAARWTALRSVHIGRVVVLATRRWMLQAARVMAQAAVVVGITSWRVLCAVSQKLWTWLCAASVAGWAALCKGSVHAATTSAAFVQTYVVRNVVAFSRAYGAYAVALAIIAVTSWRSYVYYSHIPYGRSTQTLLASNEPGMVRNDYAQQLEVRLTATEGRLLELEELVVAQRKVLNDSIVEQKRVAVQEIEAQQQKLNTDVACYKDRVSAQVVACKDDLKKQVVESQKVMKTQLDDHRHETGTMLAQQHKAIGTQIETYQQQVGQQLAENQEAVQAQLEQQQKETVQIVGDHVRKFGDKLATYQQTMNQNLTDNQKMVKAQLLEHQKETGSLLAEQKKELSAQVADSQKDLNEKLSAHAVAVDQKVQSVQTKVMGRLDKIDEKTDAAHTKVAALKENVAKLEAGYKAEQAVDKKIQKVVTEQFGMLREEMTQRTKEKVREEKRKEVLDRFFDRLIDAKD